MSNQPADGDGSDTLLMVRRGVGWHRSLPPLITLSLLCLLLHAHLLPLQRLLIATELNRQLAAETTGSPAVRPVGGGRSHPLPVMVEWSGPPLSPLARGDGDGPDRVTAAAPLDQPLQRLTTASDLMPTVPVRVVPLPLISAGSDSWRHSWRLRLQNRPGDRHATIGLALLAPPAEAVARLQSLRDHWQALDDDRRWVDWIEWAIDRVASGESPPQVACHLLGDRCNPPAVARLEEGGEG